MFKSNYYKNKPIIIPKHTEKHDSRNNIEINTNNINKSYENIREIVENSEKEIISNPEQKNIKNKLNIV